jgi:NADH:ubiquinone oxidoreductase subunit 5 (subunit L)/multisubunit Na+/H+ antiporter MnhA subunit
VAIEGPTPVSALLHAATMVTAGIFLLFRVIPIYLLDNLTIYKILSIIGLLTIILGGIGSLYQNDIKKIIAYSTTSQIGYLYYSLIIGITIGSYYHLLIHGYF